MSEQAVKRLSNALQDIGLDVEGEAKKELYPGHGVRTGTLRRSIHAAAPSYNFAGDSPGRELGGQPPAVERHGNRLLIAIGSGLQYAIWVHQGHRSFQGYHFMTIGLDKVRPRVGKHVERHRDD